MNTDVEKVDAAPVPLPPSAWRITRNLQNNIEACLTTNTRYLVLDRRFIDRERRRWQLTLVNGPTIDISVDCTVNPGTLKVVVRGENAALIHQLLDCYRRLPILKISRSISSRELMVNWCKPSGLVRPLSHTDRLKFAIRHCVTKSGYKIASERSSDRLHPWVICLNSMQQLKLDDLDQHPEDRLTVTGFGTDLDQLRDLMAVFDAMSLQPRRTSRWRG